jgi:glycolate oxidase FAD binding subunit
MIEWHGAQRWYADDGQTDFPALAKRLSGTATLYWGANRGEPAFSPLTPALLTLHRRIKQVFDPAGILSPGRLYADL